MNCTKMGPSCYNNHKPAGTRDVLLGVPELTQAINAYHSVSVSPEFQELERMRVRADHDEAQALWNAEQRGEKAKAFEIAKSMIFDREPIEKIVKYTGLNRKEIESLRDVN